MAITLNQSTHVMSRVRSGGQWSALNEATFYVDLAPNIRISEIMYNPAEPTAAEQAEGHTDNNDFEFIEIKNISATQTMPLSGLRFSDGIQFTFPNVSVGPGDYVVVVKDRDAFEYPYGESSGFIGSSIVDLQARSPSSDIDTALSEHHPILAVNSLVSITDYE